MSDKALQWLKDHGGEALFEGAGKATSGLEQAPFTLGQWKALRDAGKVAFERNGNGKMVVRVVE